MLLQGFAGVLESQPMNTCQTLFYLPVAICAVHDSPIDALAAMHVPYDEAMDLVAAWWRGNEATCLVACVDGGRAVAAVRQPDGRWVAGNAFVGDICTTRQEAERRLDKRLKRGRRGTVGVIDTKMPAHG